MKRQPTTVKITRHWAMNCQIELHRQNGFCNCEVGADPCVCLLVKCWPPPACPLWYSGLPHSFSKCVFVSGAVLHTGRRDVSEPERPLPSWRLQFGVDSQAVSRQSFITHHDECYKGSSHPDEKQGRQSRAAEGESYPEEGTFELRAEEKCLPQVLHEVRTLLDPIKWHLLFPQRISLEDSAFLSRSVVSDSLRPRGQ